MDNNVDKTDVESWKSTLVFTGDNPAYPAELFVLIMERKYGLSPKYKTKLKFEGNENVCSRILQHIPDEGDAPATLWKRTWLKEPKIPYCWPDIKKDLVRALGRKKKVEALPTAYSTRDKLVLFDSLMKGVKEKLSTYCIRVHFVASVLEHSTVGV